MFTGIVETTSRVVSLVRKGRGATLGVSISPRWGPCKVGSSIAVDGCCLTLVRRAGKIFHFDVSGETLKRTKAGQYLPGQRVNLERAMKASDRIGGHFVLGHVDAVGRVEAIHKQTQSLEIIIRYPRQLGRYLVDKGSVAIDGVGLTVSQSRGGSRTARTRKNRFSVFVVPHTARITNLGLRKKGDRVNIEVDILGKYAERLILRRHR